MNRFSKNRHRKDGNHKAIVMRLEKLGCSVRDASQLGDKGPDIIVGLLGRDYQVEIKEEGKVLEEHQAEWHREWRGQRPTTFWTVEQAELWVQNLRRKLFEED